MALPRRRLRVLVVLLAIVLTTLGVTAAAPAGAAGTDTLTSGQQLSAGAALTSADSRFRLVMQDDGNLVLYAPEGPLWWTGTTGAGNRLAVQADGNVVVYAAAGRALWASGTGGRGTVQLVAQSDGNLVLSGGSGAIWSTGTARVRTRDTAPSGTGLGAGADLTSADSRFRLVMQDDGNLVLYAPEGPLWWTGTTGAGSRLAVQTDGNVVVYAAAGRALWASGTGGRGTVRLIAQSDGNLVLYGAGGAVWGSGTRRVPTPPLGYSGSADQVVTVVVANAAATTATVTGWSRTPSGWVAAVASTPGFVGAAGVGTASEGSTRTPAGTFTLTQSFGRIANPGTRLPWFTSDSLDWWDENPASPTYNLHVRRTTSPGGASENLYRVGTAYDAAVVIDYNTARTPGAGSGFFLHVSTGSPTAGCVSVPAATVVTLLRWLDPGARPVISIGVG